MPNTVKHLIRVVIVLLGLVLLLIGYYWVHKPFDLALVASLGGMALDAGTGLLIGGIAGGIGRRLLTPLKLADSIARPERIALEAGFGLGLISSGALILGLLGQINGMALWGALLFGAVINRRGTIGWYADLRALLTSGFDGLRGWSRGLAIFVCLMLATALLRGLTPPAAWDSLTYHLVEPTRYLVEGRISTQGDNPFFGFPAGVEMVFGVALSLFGRDTAAAGIAWLYGVLALLALGGLVARHTPEAGKAIGWLAVTLLLSAFSVWLLFGQAYIDLAPMLYGALLLITLTQWRSTEQRRWLIVVGLLLGFALGAKYPAGALSVASLIFVVAASRRRDRRVIAERAILLMGMAALASLPSLIKGALLYGNPLYPYGIGGAAWDAFRAANFNGVPFVGTGSQLPILPLAATILGVEGGATYSFTSGPWLLTLPVLLILSWGGLSAGARQLARDVIWIGLPLLVYWVISAAFTGIGIQTRLMTMAFPAAAILGSLAVQGITTWPEKPIKVIFIVQVMLTLTLLLEAVEVASTLNAAGTFQYAVAAEDRDAFLFANLGVYYSAMRNLATLPAASHVRFLWEPRGYYCPVTIACRPDVFLDAWSDPYQAAASPDAIFRSWLLGGDQYVLLFDGGFHFFATETPEASAPSRVFQTALTRWMIPVWSDGVGGYTLYTWRVL